MRLLSKHQALSSLGIKKNVWSIVVIAGATMGAKAGSPQTPAAAIPEFWQNGAPSLRNINVAENSSSSVLRSSTLGEHLRKLLPDASAPVASNSDELGATTAANNPFNSAGQTGRSTFDSETAGSHCQAPFYSKLETVSVHSPGVFDLLESLSFGAGLDAMWPGLTFKSFFPTFTFGTVGDHWNSSNDQWNDNGVRGAAWNLTDHQHLTVIYGTPMDAGYPSANNAGAYGTQGGATDGELNPTAELPNIITLGYEFDLTDTIRLRTEFEWLEYAPYRSGGSDIGASTSSMNQSGLEGGAADNHNNFTSGIGGEWKFRDHWVMHFGYQFFKSPPPISAFASNIPEANQNVFTFGIGWGGKRSSLEVAYGLDFYNNQRYTGEQNIAINGNYAMNVHLMSLAYRFAF